MNRYVLFFLFMSIHLYAMDIETTWQKIFEYWEKTAPSSTEKCEGATKEELNKLNMIVETPISLRKSLTICNQSNRKNGTLFYSWFGGQSRIFTSKDIINFMINETQYYDIDESYEKVYGNVLNPKSGWPKEWIPILEAFGLFVVVDLRPNIGNQYGQILLVDPANSVLAYWASSYEEFMTKAMNILYEHGELTGNYFYDVLHQPYDEYDE